MDGGISIAIYMDIGNVNKGSPGCQLTLFGPYPFPEKFHPGDSILLEFDYNQTFQHLPLVDITNYIMSAVKHQYLLIILELLVGLVVVIHLLYFF